MSRVTKETKLMIRRNNINNKPDSMSGKESRRNV